jgi:hypothetical protein
MMSYLTGEKQVACSGPQAAKCERLNTGLCDGSAYFTVGPLENSQIRPPHHPSRQTDSVNPQYFALQIQGAASARNVAIFYSPSELDQLDLVFHCSFSGNDACPTNRFHTGAIRRVELWPLDGKNPVDLTRAATVRPDGRIVVPIDRALKDSLLANPATVYRVRAVAECFSVVPTPVHWEFPLYGSPSADARSAGTLIARVTSGNGMEFTYRSPTGEDIEFEPDRVQPDWGYTFMMDHTILDRKGDWFQLPPRPFPNSVWIQLPGREPSDGLNDGEVYTLSTTVRARRKGKAGTTLFRADTNVFLVSIQEQALEIRQEQPFDMPCTTDERTATRPQKIATYVVDAAAFYDRDLHLRLQPAYPKGC